MSDVASPPVSAEEKAAAEAAFRQAARDFGHARAIYQADAGQQELFKTRRDAFQAARSKAADAGVSTIEAIATAEKKAGRRQAEAELGESADIIR
ncbi:MAG: hypothetical protein WDN72_06445 [Alphaproteobacteria bacterium]